MAAILKRFNLNLIPQFFVVFMSSVLSPGEAEGAEGCYKISDSSFKDEGEVVVALRDFVNNDHVISSECVHRISGELPLRSKYIAPFYYILQRSEWPSFAKTSDFLLMERLFVRYVGLNASVDGNYDRFGVYVSFMQDKLAPFEKLPFSKSPSDKPPENSDENLKLLRCFIMNDDLTARSSDILASEGYIDCVK